MTDAELATLREKHRDLAEVIESDRAIGAMRAAGVIDIAAIRLRRERIRAADARWGHQLRGNGANPA